MTSYKLRPELFSLNHQKFTNSHQYSSKKQPSFNIPEQQLTNDHKQMINQIRMKNEALKGHSHQKQPNITHPNYLTFCQQYTQMLCNKYNPQPITQAHTYNRNQENLTSKPFNKQLQQKISLNLIAYKRYFQSVQFDFDKNYQQLMMRLKYLTKMLYARNSSFAQKDQQVDQELLIMDMFMSKINGRISKESMKGMSYFVTPFSLFVEDLKKRRTPDRENKSQNKQQGSLIYYDKKDFIKGDNHQAEEKRQKQSKTRSFIVTPSSPQTLLHSFNQQYNKNKHQKLALGQHHQSNQMFVSFNQQSNHHNNHNYSGQTNPKIMSGKGRYEYGNLENSQFMGDTLKYSESEIIGNEMNINLASRSVDLQQSSVEENELNGQELPFSPVQPYRLHKLYNQANLKKLNQGNSHNTHKTDDLQQQLFIEKENQALFKQAIGEIQTTLHTSIDPLKNNTQKLSLALSQTLTDVTQIIAQSHILLKEQKLSLNQDWDDVLKFISKDIQQLQHGLTIDKQQNDMKDKKFLQNLEIVQNELIEEIFEEKQSRKAEENVLTQVLTNLVENLENGLV